MSDATINWILGLVGGVMLAAGHAGLLTPEWSQFVGEVGTLLIGKSVLPRQGDTPIDELPREYQDSVRPPK